MVDSHGRSSAPSQVPPPPPADAVTTPVSREVEEKRFRARELERRAAKGDEVAARELVALAGITADRHGAEAVERAVQEALQLVLPASTPLVSAGSSMRTALAKPRQSYEDTRPVEVDARPIADYRCPNCLDRRFVYVTDDPDDSRFGRAHPCIDCTSVEERLALCGVEARFLTMTAAQMQALPGKRAAIGYCAAQWAGESVVLHSAAGAEDSTWGAGKTQLAVLLLRRRVEAGGIGRFVTYVDFLEAIKSTFDDKSSETTQGVIAHFASEPFLVVDDLGRESATDWQREQIRTLIDKRDAANLPTVVTTNAHGAEELANFVGGAVTSRLRRATWVAVGGADMRGRA